jgi:UDP-glucose 4-epimerase
LLANESLIVYGNGLQTRDFVHVTDLCQAISLALESTISGEVFQIASGTETSILDLAQSLQANFSDKPVNIQFFEARAGEITQNYSNIGKARQQLGFAPAISLEQGLAETCSWFLQQASKKEG